MSKAIQTTDFIQDFDVLTKSRVDASPEWLKSLRSTSLDHFTATGIPTTKDEEWKYTNVTPITQSKYSLLDNGELIEKNELSAYLAEDEIRLVFVNGHYSEELSSTMDQGGLTVSTLKEAFTGNEAEIKSVLEKFQECNNSFVSLNTTLVDDGAFIHVSAKAVIKELIHIVHVTSASNGKSIIVPRTVISVEKSAEASIVESHVSFNDEIQYFANACTDIYLGENATLHYSKAQKESLKATHVGNTRVWQERNSTLDSISVQCGGSVTRNNLDIVLNGEGINSTLNGLYSIYGQQHVDNHTAVDHRFPSCQSNQLYKGILNEDSRAVFNGKIFVKPIAQQTNSYQLNKNLLLGSGCRVDTKPQLEIFADDVRCTHGATVGQLNEDELFYMQTRCIPREQAVKMLAQGFVNDLIDTIKSEEVVRKMYILLQPSFDKL